jgi:cytochrome c
MEKAFVVVAVLMMAGGVHLPHAADAHKGKILFQRVGLGGGATGNSCISCHRDGKGLGNLFQKDKFTTMGVDKDNLADVVNVCIEKSLGGVALDPQGAEMTDLLAFMKILVDPSARK